MVLLIHLGQAVRLSGRLASCAILLLGIWSAISTSSICYAEQTADSGPVTRDVVVQLLDSDPQPSAFFVGPIPRTPAVSNDARLNDVCCVGKNLWAVGERGVICRSADSGFTWTTGVVPFECSLHSVCFLTDRIGFIAGFHIPAHSRRSRAVLLKTRDGGTTWSVVPTTAASAQLSGLTYVKFFDADNGFVVGHKTGRTDSQVFRTTDGGNSWEMLASDRLSANWNGAFFASENDGIVFGQEQAFGAVVADQIIGLTQPQKTLRAMNGGLLTRSGSGWLVGDRGTVLTSSNGGISWTVPNAILNREVGELFDFHAVAESSGVVCIAGSPGTAVMTTSDNGQTWSIAGTDQPNALRAMCDVSAGNIVAVGDLGTIVRSSDFGSSWNVVRNSGYRCALMSIATDADDVGLAMTTSISGELGYRSVVLQPSLVLEGDKTVDGQISDRQCLTAGVTWLGAHSVESDWMFPRSHPEQKHVRESILAEWNSNTDGQLSVSLPLRLARQIRIWRPNVVTVERSSDDDQVAEIWLHALGEAQRIAAGEHTSGTSLDGCGLERWQVDRVLVRSVPGTQSALVFETQDLLRQLNSTSELIAGKTRDVLTLESSSRQMLHSNSYRAVSSGQLVATPAQMFSGLHQNGSSDCRRSVVVRQASSDESHLVLKQYQSSNAALLGHTHHLKSEVSLIGHVRQVGRGFPDSLALRQLWNLAELHQSHENIEGRIAVLREITRRFGSSKDAAVAASELFTIYSSAELRLFRLRDRRGSSSTNSQEEQRQIVQGVAEIPGSLIEQTQVQPASAVQFENSIGSDITALEQTWNRNADLAYQILSDIDEEAATASEVCLRRASNLRRTRVSGEQFSVLARAAQNRDPFAVFANAEQHAIHGAVESPIVVTNLPQSTNRPVLDAVLDDECWQRANELVLTADDQNAPDCRVMLAWDRDYLYVAGRVERIDQSKVTTSESTDRHQDSDHGTFDRIELDVDIDRDYSTAFQFVFDESGGVSESCCGLDNWDPEWFVANDSEPNLWRFEAAIPVSEISKSPLKPGLLWGIRLQRVVPGYLRQSLASESEEAVAAGHGLIRMIRAR